MSTCLKSFIQSVTAPPYYAYYKLDEAAPANMLVDQIGGFNMTRFSGIATSIAGKIGTAMSLGGVNRPQWITADDHWILTGSFTIRIWFKPVHDSGSSLFLIHPQFRVSKWGTVAPPTFDAYIFFDVVTTAGSVSLQSSAMTVGAWNHVVCVFESGVGLTVYINNGAPTVSATVNLIQPIPSGYILIDTFAAAGPDGIDEIAIWNKKLTAAEITADWNGGNGVTYP